MTGINHASNRLKINSKIHKNPLISTGYIGNTEVEIIQLESFTGSIDSFEFKIFPNEFENLKDQIIQWVSNIFRTMGYLQTCLHLTIRLKRTRLRFLPQIKLVAFPHRRQTVIG